jgi:hypothetical protein
VIQCGGTLVLKNFSKWNPSLFWISGISAGGPYVGRELFVFKMAGSPRPFFHVDWAFVKSPNSSFGHTWTKPNHSILITNPALAAGFQTKNTDSYHLLYVIQRASDSPKAFKSSKCDWNLVASGVRCTSKDRIQMSNKCVLGGLFHQFYEKKDSLYKFCKRLSNVLLFFLGKKHCPLAYCKVYPGIGRDFERVAAISSCDVWSHKLSALLLVWPKLKLQSEGALF